MDGEPAARPRTLRQRLLRALLGLLRAVLRRPRLKRLARRALHYCPPLQAQLQGLLYRNAFDAAPALAPGQPRGDLSPRSIRMYLALKRAQEQIHEQAQLQVKKPAHDARNK